MFNAKQRLPHLLSPTAYSSDESYAWEIANVFTRSWHFVTLRAEISRPGDFVTTEICGQPMQVRNVAGTIHALSNVCAHRHCLMTSDRQGSSPKISCQYHGWEYDHSGATQRIPLAQHFAPLDRNLLKIPVYRVAQVGPLVFVNLDPDAPDLSEFLGDRCETVQRSFDERYEVMLCREFTHSANWKVPVENTLEAYHVPAVHPDTFRVDPGEESSQHEVFKSGTSFHTSLPFAAHSTIDMLFQRAEGRLMRSLLGCAPTASYQQHHLFPNILFSFTDMTSLLHVVQPTGPQTCKSIVYQFGRVGSSFVSRQFCRLWGRLAVGITQRILQEDFQLYPAIQRGLNASRNPGMLGRCEERIYEFQRWLQNHPKSADKTIVSKSSLNHCDGESTADCQFSRSFPSRELPQTSAE